MDSVLRVVVMYAFLLLVFRLTGNRTLGQATTFDFLMLLILSETTQQALVKDDHSMTHAFLLILTFITIDLLLSFLKLRCKAADKVLDGAPVVLAAHGTPLLDRMRRARVDDEDILEAAREKQGVSRLDQIAYAVLERNGQISILPVPSSAD
jgi:uncharacterized membrane protein YcaP (DUF421 family)